MCNICGKQYKKAAYLERHKQNHFDFQTTEFLNEDPAPSDIEIEKSEEYDNAGNPVAWVCLPSETINYTSDIFPFTSQKAFNLAKWLVMNDIPVNAVDQILKGATDVGLDPTVLRELPSSYVLREKVAMMNNSIPDWYSQQCRYSWTDGPNSEPLLYYKRNTLECTKWFLRQLHFKNHLHYAPRRNFVGGRRIYGDMHTADWWWKQQVRFRILLFKYI